MMLLLAGNLIGNLSEKLIKKYIIKHSKLPASKKSVILNLFKSLTLQNKFYGNSDMFFARNKHAIKMLITIFDMRIQFHNCLRTFTVVYTSIS